MLQAMRNAIARKTNNVERHPTLGGAAMKYAINAIANRTQILAWVRMYLGPQIGPKSPPGANLRSKYGSFGTWLNARSNMIAIVTPSVRPIAEGFKGRSGLRLLMTSTTCVNSSTPQ
jgi:hypothetical protein